MPVMVNTRYFLKIVGIFGWILGLVAFGLSFIYMTETITFGSTGSLAETNFFGLIGVAFFISGTMVYLKSLEYEK